MFLPAGVRSPPPSARGSPPHRCWLGTTLAAVRCQRFWQWLMYSETASSVVPPRPCHCHCRSLPRPNVMADIGNFAVSSLSDVGLDRDVHTCPIAPMISVLDDLYHCQVMSGYITVRVSSSSSLSAAVNATLNLRLQQRGWPVVASTVNGRSVTLPGSSSFVILDHSPSLWWVGRRTPTML